MIRSSAVSSYLASLAGEPAEVAPRHTMPTRAGPRVRMLEDPLEDLHDIIDDLDGSVAGARPNGYLQRRKARNSLDQSKSGVVAFEGRICCAEHLMGLNRRLHLLELPYNTSCECGAKYVIEMGVQSNG